MRQDLEYPSNLRENPYNGPLVGNPDLSTCPKMRWTTSLETIGNTAKSKRFCPPAAQVAILVPRETALLYRPQWRRICAAFSACADVRLHTGFLLDHELMQTGVPSTVRVILAPVLEFICPVLRAKLESFTAAGGMLLVADSCYYDMDGNSAAVIKGAIKVDDELFDVFPLDNPSSSDALGRLSEIIAERVKQQNIDSFSWVFDISCESLPPANKNPFRKVDPDVSFETWMYEHSSDWILPYTR